MLRRAPPCLAAVMAVACLPLAAVAAPTGDVERLEAEIERLKERLDSRDRIEQRVRELEVELERIREQDAPAREDAGTATTEAPTEPDKDIAIGGALRFNYFLRDFDDAGKTKRGDSGLDMFALGADGRYDDVLISAQYRWYPFMQTIHHGWIGYDFERAGQLELGVTKVPFGLLPYAAHNFWFGVPYYMGMGDDYDLGVKYVDQRGPWDTQLAFFKNAELGSSTNLERYSFDVVSVDASGAALPNRNEETNQVNARLAYTFGHETGCSHETGISAMAGELFNRDTDETGERWAAAAHLDSRCGRWNVQLQLGRYGFDPKNPAGVGDDTVRLGGFASSYNVAAQGNLGVANVAYNLPVPWARLDQLTCYNDFSILDKDLEPAEDSMLNTTGCAIAIGPLFTYVDVINARNMVFFSDGSLAGGGNDSWDTRLNINVGYYW